MTTTIQTAKPVLPPWTAEDFFGEAPYAWLYQQREKNKFGFALSLRLTIKQASSLGIKELEFKQLWKAYQESMMPKNQILGANMTDFPGQPKALQCGEYSCAFDGVKIYGRMGEEIQVINHPILPVSRIEDVETGEQQIQIQFCRSEMGSDAEWKTLTFPKETISSAQKIVALSGKGVGVTTENAKELVKFLARIEDLNYAELITQKSCRHMGWLPNGEFAPYTDKVMFAGDSEEYLRLYKNFTPHGDENVWLTMASQVRHGKSVPARIVLAASLAAPLIHKLGALSFFVHFWGASGSGKTVALLLGASVWGNPEIGGYIKSFSGTKVSQEKLASFCGNLPVFLDELQVISDRRIFDDLIYSLCEGVSKGRGTKEGGLQTASRWATVFLTTGEMPMIQANSGGGAAARVIEVNYGDVPFFEDPRKAANVLKLNYGFAGPKIITALKDKDTMQKVREWQEEFYGKLAGAIQDKQVLSASLILAADRLADEVLFHDGKSLTVNDLRPYLITTEQADMNQRCYQYLTGWIASNQSRFSKSIDDNRGEPWGVYEDENGRDIVYIIKGVFDKALADGNFSAGAFLSWAKRNKLLKTKRYDNNTIQKTVGDMRPVCVAVYMPGEEQDINSVTSEQEELPF